MLAGASVAGLWGWPATSTPLPLGDPEVHLWPGPPPAVLKEATERRRRRLTPAPRESSPHPCPWEWLCPPFPSRGLSQDLTLTGRVDPRR